MTVKIFVLTTASPDPVQVGPTYFATSDAASSISGGDFSSDLRDVFPAGGVTVTEIRIVQDDPKPLVWSD